MLSRVILYSAQGYAMGDLDPSMVMSCVRTEEINGEHSLSLSTVTHLYIGMRILMQDTTGKWREYVVDEEDEEHSSGRNAIGTYHAMWSIQYDLSTTAGGVQWASVEEGTNEPVMASNALAAALTDSVMWRPGTCDVVTLAAASFYDASCWDYLSIIVETWGGEIDAEITVDDTGVVTRQVALMAHLGSATAKRRFDWGRDLTRIRRIPDPGPYYCRVVPRGGGEGTDSDGVKYSDRCGIESENDGVPYLQDDEAAELFKTMLPDGTWFYPTKVVTYQLDTQDDAEELYNKALEDLYNHTRPNVSYEADVVQLAIAGLNVQGVALGDDVHCVDSGFGDLPLRIEGRVVSMTVNEINPSDTTLTIGRMQHTLSDEFTSLSSTVGQVSSRVTLIESGGTSAYVRSLIDRMNQEINATDGWTYIVPNEGIIVYDIEVDDPIMGYNSTLDQYASSVVQIKGGGIRIANTRKPEFAGINDWNWKSVFDAGHIAAELVTAVNMTTGFIGNASSGTFIDLDNDVVRIGTTAQLGGRSVLDILDGIDATVTDVDVQFAENQSADTAPTTGWSTTAPAYREGYYIWQRTATTTGHGTSATTTYSDPVRINTHDGQDGQDGANGKGISSIVEQYYLSTSASTQTDGSWSDTPAAYVSGRYYWTRTIITWSDNTTTTTTPVIARAINSANENALDARTVATNYLTFNSTTGVDVGYAGTSAKTRVNGSGVTIYDGSGNDRLNASTSGIRVGKSNGYHSSISDTAFELLNGSNVSTFKADSSSVRIGKASGAYHAVASKYSFSLVDDSGRTVFKVGEWDEPIGEEILVVVTSMVFGLGLLTESEWQTVLGKYNVKDSNSTYALVIGGGSSTSNRKNIFTVDWNGNINAGAYSYIKSTNIDRDGSNPSADTGGDSRLVFRDKDNESIGQFLPVRATNGAIYLRMQAHAENASGTQVSNYFDVRVDRSGNQTYAMSSPAAFRDAIGMPTTSVSGTDKFEPRWIGTDIQYAAINVSSFYAHKVNGRMVQFYLSGTLDVSVSANGSTVLGTIPSGYRPIQAVGVDAYSITRRATVSTGGSVTLYSSSAIAEGASVTITGVYISSS